MMSGRRFTLTLLAAGLAARALAQPAPSDGLNLRFANGIAAIAEEKVITVDDVRREIAPLIPQLQRESRNEKEFNDRLESLQDDVIQQLIDRVLIVKEFRKDEKKHIPSSFVENRIAEIQSEQFDNDRSKFLAYLRGRGITLRDYHREVEEDIIYQYMRQQQRKSQSVVSPVKIETFYRENKDRFYQEDSVHLRLMQFTRTNAETDAELKTKADTVLARLKAGVKFEDLAKEFSQDSRRAKGGDWGWVKRSDFRKEFTDIVFNMKKDECSQPVMLPEGCFLLYVEDRKYAGIQQLDDVRDQIERILVQQMGQASQERWLERLRRNGYVKHF
jgi:peptidyl-prolyl cis-trans isomerase SurA